MKKIFIGADHRGFAVKQEIMPYLTKAHDFVEVIDCGAGKYDKDDDYNDYANAVVKAVLRDLDNNYGILICGSSFGVNIQANRFKHIRAVNPHNEELAKLSREHNNANVLCLSADFLKTKEIKDIIYAFFHTKYSGKDRYERRNQRLDKGNN